MPWKEVLESLKLFTYWQTYAALSAYLMLVLLPRLFDEMVPEEHARGHFIIATIRHAFQAFGTLFLALSLAPVLLGISAKDGWDFASFSAHDPSYLMRFVLTQSALLFCSIMLAVIPFVRHLHALHVAVLSIMGLTLMLPALNAFYPGLQIHRLSLLPKPVFLAGFLFLTALVTWIGAMISRWLLESWDAELTAVGISTALGLMPFFVYGMWLGIQLDSILFPAK